MGQWLTAGPGDTFCSIAVDAGFVNCDPVRNHAANLAIRDKQIEPGMDVYVPDLVERHDSAATEKLHVYVRKGVAFASIRFVHGSRTDPVAADVSLAHLEISNYRTDRAGANGTEAFAGPDHWRFNAASDADPDTFKIEVRETQTGKARLDVTLEALHPIYDAGGAVTGHDLSWSSAAERDRRKLDIQVHRATPKPDQRFRSAYLRLVVDEQDKAARPRQTLLVTDDQPNEERVEILDQMVRATYKIESCPRAGTAVQCQVSAQLPVGNDRRRIRLCVGIIRRNIGDATGFHGVTAANVRHRVFRWFRRVFAQANMAPVLVHPDIRLLDPPERNMLTVSNISGNRADGRTPAGATPSRMSFTVSTDRVGVAAKTVSLNIAAAASPATRPTPKQIAEDLKALIDDADFEATLFENAAALGRAATRRSADIIIKDKTPGHRITISAVSSTDRSATLRLAIVSLSSLRDFDNAQMIVGTMDERQIIRNYDSGDDRLDCYVVGGLRSGARGESFLRGYDLHVDYQAGPPVPFTCIMGASSSSGRVMDGSNNLPYTFPHEAGHALLDCNHAVRRSELMAGGGTSVSPSMRGTKRICDAPLALAYERFHETNQTPPGRMRNYRDSAATRLSSLATGLSADKFLSW